MYITLFYYTTKKTQPSTWPSRRLTKGSAGCHHAYDPCLTTDIKREEKGKRGEKRENLEKTLGAQERSNNNFTHAS